MKNSRIKEHANLANPVSQYQFAMECLHRNEWDKYQLWLEQAAINGHLEALIQMGENLLYGKNHCPQNIAQGYEYMITAKQRLDCHHIKSSNIPDLQTLSKSANVAFIRVKNDQLDKLFFFDKSMMIMKEIPMSPDKLTAFDKLNIMNFPYSLTVKNLKKIMQTLGVTFPSINLALKENIDLIFNNKTTKELLNQYIVDAEGIKLYRQLTFQTGIKPTTEILKDVQAKMLKFIDGSDFMSKMQTTTIDQKILLICYIIDFDPVGLNQMLKSVTNSAFLAFRHNDIKEPFTEKNYLTPIAVKFIKKLLEDLPPKDKKVILQTAFGLINDYRVPIIDKKFIMEEIAPELTEEISYQNTEVLPPLLQSKSKETVNISQLEGILDQLLQLKIKVSLGDVILLTLSYIKNNPQADKEQLLNIYNDYLLTDYEKAFSSILEFLKSTGQSTILTALSSLTFKEDEIQKNFSRRFFENRISQFFLAKEMDLEIIQKFTKAYGFNPLTRQEAFRAILHIEERLSYEELKEKGPAIQKSLTYKKGLALKSDIYIEESFRRSGVSISPVARSILDVLYDFKKSSNQDFNIEEFLESVKNHLIVCYEYKTITFNTLYLPDDKETDFTQFLKLLKENSIVKNFTVQEVISGLTEAMTALKIKNEKHIVSSNLGVLTSNSPNFSDELSSQPNPLRNTDFSVAERGSYAEIKHRSSLVRSFSGHAAFFVMHLENYMEAHKDETTLTKEVNVIIKTFAMIYLVMNFHSYLEVMDVFNDKNLRDFFKKYNVEIDPNLSNEVLAEALKDTGVYNKNLTLKKMLHAQLEKAGTSQATLNDSLKMTNEAILHSKSVENKNLHAQKDIQFRASENVIERYEDTIASTTDINKQQIYQAFDYILHKYPKCRAEILCINIKDEENQPPQYILVVNRDKNSKIEDMSTYGENAVIWTLNSKEPFPAIMYRRELKISVVNEKKENEVINYNYFKHKFKAVESTDELRLAGVDAILLLKKQFLGSVYSIQLTLENFKTVLQKENKRMHSFFGEYDARTLIIKNKIIEIENLIQKLIDNVSQISYFKNNYRAANLELNERFSKIMNATSALVTFTSDEKELLFKQKKSGPLESINCFSLSKNPDINLLNALEKTVEEIKTIKNHRN